MALEGSIRDFSLADIFQLIGIQRKTGVLTLRTRDEEVKVSFLNGMVVNADSRTKRLDDRLGTVLTKTGKLGEEDLKRALKIQKDTLKKIGVVLVEENMVRPEDLREALGIQITQIIYRLFRWKDGDYHFEQDVNVDFDKDNFTPMSAESILMEGMRMIDEWPIIERKITSFDMVFERVPLDGAAAPQAEAATAGARDNEFDAVFGDKGGGDEPSTAIRLGREESLVYEQVNGKVNVQEIVERTMLSEFETCRALFDLMNRNLIAQVAAPTKVTATTKPPKARIQPHAGRLGYAVVLALAAVAALFQGRNPLNLLTLPVAPHNRAVNGLRAEMVKLQVSRVGEAIETFAFTEARPPSSAGELVEAGLLDPAELFDPWGRPLAIAIEGGLATVAATDRPGDDGGEVRDVRRLDH